MKVEMTEEAIVFCDGVTCDPHKHMACEDCPFRPIFKEFLSQAFKNIR